MQSEKKTYLAIDIGASSGRLILGWQEEGVTRTEEIFRFPNELKSLDGHLMWDAEALVGQIVQGLRTAFERAPEIRSLAIDTWGCDYVLLGEDGKPRPCFAYRDHRTQSVLDEAHALVPFETLYARTGIQFQPFNTIYQLYEDQKQGRLQGATDFLMMPEYIAYRLTGKKRKEYTNATTTGLISAKTKQWEKSIVSALGLPERLFPALHQTGETVGMLQKSIADEVGGNCRVVLCATHDTASAVEGIPMEGDALYISSGTWSLLGAKVPSALTDEGSRRANYSNEGGIGYIRYQKNIMGMWVVNRLREELCPDRPFGEIVKAAERSSADEICDVNAPEFLSPESMTAAFDDALGQKPRTPEDYFRCAYRSLAESYAGAIRELEANTGRTYDTLYIVGGGAKNAFLNALTEERTGKRVVALPIEATAMGNLKIQMEADV